MLRGIQFFIDSKSQSEIRTNYRYEYVESYEVTVLFPSKYDWFGTGDSFKVFKRDPLLETCYRISQSTSTLLGTTRGQIENEISEFPIRFVDHTEPTLIDKYLLKIRQYAISNEAYNFHKKLKENNHICPRRFKKSVNV